MDQHEELRSRLLEQRTVLLTGTLDAAGAERAAGALMLLSHGGGPVDLRLMGRDGDLDAALALADTIDVLGVEVWVHAMGVVGGAVLAPLAAATRRVASPHATFVLTNPPATPSAGRDLTVEAAGHAHRLAALHRRLADACGITLDEVVADMRRGRVLNAPEAEAYGLVDAVVPARP